MMKLKTSVEEEEEEELEAEEAATRESPSPIKEERIKMLPELLRRPQRIFPLYEHDGFDKNHQKSCLI